MTGPREDLAGWSAADLSGRPAVPVTAVIASYRSAASVEVAIASVAAQTSPPREVIVVDDASGDGTVDAVLHLAKDHPAGWLRVVARSTNGGPSAARNSGWNAARFPYVAFLDADDTWLPSKLEVQYGWMKSHPDVDLCAHASTVLTDRRRGETRGAEERELDVDFVSLQRLLWSNRIATSTVMVRRGVAERFDEARRRSEDYALWLSMAFNRRRIAILGAELTQYGKPKFGAGGLSGGLWLMEAAQLDVYRTLVRHSQISRIYGVTLCLWSLARYVRRVVIVALRRYRRVSRVGK